ncbi:uncharacterized protein LOC115312598 [Ixodes scapularis]|uniref:uncharacterized protein LOC115312598 n=1 Tax=Ixodes scapularis TaxID=6945 RepID=UPI001C3858E6|nr:uncharacterized protein LOC115312598 [Ixodes scapularis]
MSGQLPNKTLLCTFGIQSTYWIKGPQEGLCDIIILDCFYNLRTATFLDRREQAMEWFLGFVRKDSGSTQFGLGIHHSNALQAYNDLNVAVGMNTFRDFWNLNIRHYCLLTFQVHDAFITNRSTVQGYDKLLKRLRELQEVNRAGAVDKFGYVILAVGLLAPRRGNAYNYLKELLQ